MTDAVTGVGDADLRNASTPGRDQRSWLQREAAWFLMWTGWRDFFKLQPMKIKSLVIITVLVFGFIAFPLKVHAVSPPPDGGYPGGNTAEGQKALLSLTTGGFNTAVGFLSLESDTTGQLNTAVGAGTLLANTGDSNTATGAGALLSNTAGTENTANGAFALFSNTTGNFNTASGATALQNNTVGVGNTAVGAEALLVNTEGARNTASGFDALFQNTTGSQNTANGSGALFSNTTGNDNVAVGRLALANNAAGSENTAVGNEALQANTAVNNTAVGFQALATNVSGAANTAIGFSALSNNTGDFNIALGNNAGAALTTGSVNIHIGNGGVAGDDHTTRIGSVETRAFIAGIRNVTTGNNNAIPVLIDSAGQLGTMSSSRRFKKDINPMDTASEAILALKPVRFHYKSDSTNRPEFGLIAEQVAAVNPNLVVRDANGSIYTVRYDAVNAMLLNEFLKAHRKLEEQDKQIETLTNKLQKVSDQLELNMPGHE